MEPKDDLEVMLGAARFATYLREADGDVERAVSLYRWNAQLSSALHYQLSHFEVLTRNAIDITLREWNYKVCGHREWSFEGKSAGLLYRILRRPMAQARKRAQQESRRRKVGHARRNASFTHDDVVSQFTLGNWSTLLGEALPVHHESAKVLWSECLHKAFSQVPALDTSREDIGRKFERITHLRNRVSHQENLLSTNVNRRLNDMLSVLGAINPDYPGWSMSGSPLRRVTRSDPRRVWALDAP